MFAILHLLLSCYSPLPSHHHTPLLENRTPPGDCIHCWWGGLLLTVLLNCMEQLVWQPRANPMLYYKHFNLLARPCLPPACHQCAFIQRILEWPFDPPFQLPMGLLYQNIISARSWMQSFVGQSCKPAQPLACCLLLVLLLSLICDWALVYV